jgi:hypothetical protein
MHFPQHKCWHYFIIIKIVTIQFHIYWIPCSWIFNKFFYFRKFYGFCRILQFNFNIYEMIFELWTASRILDSSVISLIWTALLKIPHSFSTTLRDERIPLSFRRKKMEIPGKFICISLEIFHCQVSFKAMHCYRHLSYCDMKPYAVCWIIEMP